jgi:hypothetical protein
MIYRDFYIEHSVNFNAYYIYKENESVNYLCRDLELRLHACNGHKDMFKEDTAWYKTQEEAKQTVDNYYVSITPKTKKPRKQRKPRKQQTVDSFVVSTGKKVRIDGSDICVMFSIRSDKLMLFHLKDCNRWNEKTYDRGQVVTAKDITTLYRCEFYDEKKKKYLLLKQ